MAIENSSAYAALIGKVLPATLLAESTGGERTIITFKRIIVYPNGHEHIEGETPLQIEHKASHVLPSDASSTQQVRDTDDKDVSNQ